MYVHFRKKMRLDNKVLDLKFVPGITLQGTRYFVTITAAGLQPFSFYMQQQNGRWKIVDTPGVTAWIRAAENSLQSTLEEHQVFTKKHFLPAICNIP